MKRILSLLTLLTAAFVQLSADEATINPQASPEAVVTSGRARFTVLTPQMIRIQWSTRQNFEDRATFAVVNRNLPVPSFTTREEDGYLYIQTEALTLRYKVGSTISPLMKSPNNLSITMPLKGHDVVWYPGKEDALNLKGTRRTLDGGSGDNYRPDMEDGIISRAGWAVIDESPRTKRGDGSTTFAFDGQVDGIDWLAEPADKNAYDWYFMGYGHDYKNAIGDYIKIAGRQPMPPLYALGYWYSKYQRYSQQDFLNLANEIRRNNIPIDVMIMDMDWHLDGWTGWTWNKQLIPNPEGLLNWMHNQGLKVSLNLHPADGVASYEDHYGEISAATVLSENGRASTSSASARSRASTSGGSTGSRISPATIPTASARHSGATTSSTTTCASTAPTAVRSSSTAGADWAATATLSVSQVTPTAPSARWPSSLTSRLPPPTCASAIGDTTSADTCR